MALFENLTARLSRTVDTLRGRGRITEENVGESLREVRIEGTPTVEEFMDRRLAPAMHTCDATSAPVAETGSQRSA